MLRTITLVVVIAALGSGVAHAQQKVEIKGQSAKAKISHVVSGKLSELNGKYQLRAVEATFAPGGSVGPHNHAGPGIRCITGGEMTYISADGKTTVYKAGDCFYEAGDESHSVRNATDKPLVLLNFEIVPASVSGGSIIPVPVSK